MKLFILIAALSSSFASAIPLRDQYEISAEIYVKDQLVSTPRILALAGEEAGIQIGNEKQYFKMNVTPFTVKKGVHMEMAIESDDGHHQLKTSHIFLAKPGAETVIKPNRDVQINVVAKLKKTATAEKPL